MIIRTPEGRIHIPFHSGNWKPDGSFRAVVEGREVVVQVYFLRANYTAHYEGENHEQVAMREV